MNYKQKKYIHYKHNSLKSETLKGGCPEHLMKKLDMNTKKFIEELSKPSTPSSKPNPPIYKLPVKEARAVLDGLQADPKYIDASLKTNLYIKDIPDFNVDGKNIKVNIKIIKPDNNSIFPVIMYFHGGGWVLGNYGTHSRLVNKLVSECNVAIAFVEYTPSPEAKFPEPTEQAYAATKFIHSNGSEFKLDTSKLIVAGDSVGGNMAIAVTMMAKKRGGPPINAQLLFYPVTDARMNTSSYCDYQEGFWLTKKSMEWFFDNYLSVEENRNNPLISPLQASLEDLKGLPKTLLITDENDVLRDEGEAYAHKLMQAEVDVAAFRVIGTVHDFLMLNPLKDTPPVKSTMDLIISIIKKIINK